MIMSPDWDQLQTQHSHISIGYLLMAGGLAEWYQVINTVLQQQQQLQLREKRHSVD